MIQWGWHSGSLFWGGLGMLLFWGLVLVLLIVAIRALWRIGQGSTPPVESRNSVTPSQPLQILQTRYAKGEITKEQYEEMRQELMAT